MNAVIGSGLIRAGFQTFGQYYQRKAGQEKMVNIFALDAVSKGVGDGDQRKNKNNKASNTSPSS
jgi:hypothetical protein